MLRRSIARAQHRPAERAGDNEEADVELAALLRGEQLAVVDAVPGSARIEHHRGGHHRPGERAAAGLIHAGDGQGITREPRLRAGEAAPGGRHGAPG